MFKEKLTAFLKIRPDETRMVLQMAGLFLCLQAGQGIGENAAFTLFLIKINVDYLPYMYMGLGVAVFIASIAFSASLSRFQNASVINYLLAGSVILFTVEWLAIIVFRSSASYPVLWLTTYGMGVVLGTLLWTAAGEVCDTRQAKRLYPLFTSMGILGSVLGNLLTGAIARLAGTEGLILFYAILLGLGFWLVRRITSAHFRPESKTQTQFSLIDDVRSGYNFVRSSQLFRLIAISSIFYSILFFTVDFPFSERISELYPNDAAGLAGFKGLFTSITTAFTFLVSLFIANRIYGRIGVVNSVLIMPVTYIGAFVLFFVSFTFWGAVTARFTQLVILGGVAGTAWNALFNVVPPERRGQVLAFNNGVPAQIGVVLSGVLIILSRQVLETQQILLLGAAVAITTTYLTLRMRSAYGEALLSALRSGRTDVFSADEEAHALISYRNDPAALQIIRRSLQDPRPETRRLAVEMLARMGSRAAIPDLLKRLGDGNPSVRAASIRALADLGAKAAARILIRKLNDPDLIVKEATLESLPRLHVTPSPELVHTLRQLSRDRKNLKIKAHAAVVLMYFGKSEMVRPMLYRLLKNKDVKKREIGLDALVHIAEDTAGDVPFRVHTILAGLDDAHPIIRRETIRVFSLMNGKKDFNLILPALADDDAGVRKLTSATLKQAWPETRSGIVHILEEMNIRALDAALDAIPAGMAENLEMMRGYIQRETSKIWYLRTLINSLRGQGGKFAALLSATLKHRILQSEERLIKAVGLFGNPRALAIVRRSLNAGDANTRAAALEALETLGDPTITKEVIPILDRGGVFAADDEQVLDLAIVIGGMLESTDYWLRAIAARLVAELDLKASVPALKKLRMDSVPLVRQAARDALVRIDGDGKMKTLKTLSILDRILLLREIPMFTQLSPEDLEKIAEVADEQLFPMQTTICKQGEHGDSMYVIVAGDVQVLMNTEEGPATLAVRGAGEFVGEMAILESSTRSASMVAATDVRLLILDGESFKAILRDRPEVAISVLQHMSRRVRELNERVRVDS